MNGKILLEEIFNKQVDYQKQVTGLEQIPVDSVKWYSYHMAAMQEELGEILKADKRWKTHRNVAYDPQNKLEEIADAFITILNIAMFSGFSNEDLTNAVNSKIKENLAKYLGSEGNEGKSKE